MLAGLYLPFLEGEPPQEKERQHKATSIVSSLETPEVTSQHHVMSVLWDSVVCHCILGDFLGTCCKMVSGFDSQSKTLQMRCRNGMGESKVLLKTCGIGEVQGQRPTFVVLQEQRSRREQKCFAFLERCGMLYSTYTVPYCRFSMVWDTTCSAFVNGLLMRLCK